MFKPLTLLAAPALLLGGLTATPVTAATHIGQTVSATAWADASADQYRGRDDRYRPGDRYYDDRNDRRAERRYERQQQRRYDRRYDDRRYERRSDNRCDNGTGGALIGAIAGGLVGNGVARYGDKTEGAIIGALAGGVLGNVIDKRDDPCRRTRTRGYRR